MWRRALGLFGSGVEVELRPGEKRRRFCCVESGFGFHLCILCERCWKFLLEVEEKNVVA